MCFVSFQTSASSPAWLPSQQPTAEGPRSGGTAGGDGSWWLVGTWWLLMGFGFSPPHRGESPSPIAQLWVFITRAFLFQLITLSSFQEARPAGRASPSSPRHVISLT